MTPCSSLIMLMAMIATAAVTFTDAFSPTSVVGLHPTATTHASPIATTTARSMGMFDSFSKAFSNEEYGAPPDALKATARHILVPTLDEAEAVLAEIGRGEASFASLAGKHSTCPSKSRGGSLGSFGPGTMVKEFDDVAFSQETRIGEVNGPIQTEFGYHLLVVDKRTGGSDYY